MIRSVTPVLIFLFIVCTTLLHAQGFGIVVDHVDAKKGDVVCVPVRAKGFNEILSFQFSVNSDASVLTFNNVQNFGLTGLTVLDFSNHQQNLLISWSHPTGHCSTKADGDVLFEVCYTAMGDVGTFSALTPGSMGFGPTVGGAEAVNCSLVDVWSDESNEPGSVTITAVSEGTSSTFEARAAQSAFKLFPNPTHAGTQILLDAPASGWAVLRVIDPLGKSVWASSTDVLQGNNALRIPATAFPTQGLYSVSVQTAHGVSTQMLLVR